MSLISDKSSSKVCWIWSHRDRSSSEFLDMVSRIRVVCLEGLMEAVLKIFRQPLHVARRYYSTGNRFGSAPPLVLLVLPPPPGSDVELRDFTQGLALQPSFVDTPPPYATALMEQIDSRNFTPGQAPSNPRLLLNRAREKKRSKMVCAHFGSCRRTHGCRCRTPVEHLADAEVDALLFWQNSSNRWWSARPNGSAASW
jgi:hypothetical protein